MVQHYALKPKGSHTSVPVENTLLESSLNPSPRGFVCPFEKLEKLSKRVFQQGQTYGSLRFKGIVSDHGS